MSNIQRFENLKQIVQKEQTTFNSLAKIHNAVVFEKEAQFALQALQTNDFLAGVAMNDQDSLKRAIINVAAIGLSLNPVQKLAYLVPRKKSVCLDLSYLGLIKLATDCGAVKFVVAELVYENDTFMLLGIGKEPKHEFQPFGDRGKLKGAYCVAKTHSDDYLTTVMSIEDVYKIRDRSESWKAGANSPWKSDEGEMIKKTVVRRASKMWPKTSHTERFEKAIDISNQNDGSEIIETTSVDVTKEVESKIAKIRETLKLLNRQETTYIAYLCKACGRDIKKIEDMTEIEIDQQTSFLKQTLENQNKKQIASPNKTVEDSEKTSEQNSEVATNEKPS